ncbi:MAG: penicillin-binding protein activator [Hyphomonas sp.]|nr:penicillin-binding protein activator [Hyphomonas sp.]MAU68045.1 penicillin-binding protein activator [Hyphomonas sp.]MBM56829.1 penicillin-binding protein activator [Hyphomonas sp.]
MLQEMFQEMTLLQPLLRTIKAPSFLLIGFLFATACASAPARPPVQIGTGTPRVEPITGPVDQPEEGVDVTDLGEPEDLTQVRGDGGLTPAFMEGREIKRAAVLLPFSHPNAQVRAEAESMLAGIELALFQYAGDDFLIIPKDTAGKTSVTEARMDEAVQEKANVVLGPLFGANVKAITERAQDKNIPVIAFSNDRSAAGGGAYLASISPEEEVRRMVQYAAGQGIYSFVFLGPQTAYGRQIETALRTEAFNVGGTVLTSAFYMPETGPTEAARSVSGILKSEIATRPRNKVAVMIPERGVKLLSIAPLLPYNGVDMTHVTLMGTSLWSDESVWREPTLDGAVYPAPDPENLTTFREAYRRIYGKSPTDLAAVAYDAAAVAVSLAGEDNLKYNGVTNPDGFFGVNGLFRFRLDGTSERGLAVMQIRPTGAELIEKGASQFGPGPS